MRVEVDETSPIARVQVRAGDPIVRHGRERRVRGRPPPRELSELAVATAAGRMLLRLPRPRDARLSTTPRRTTTSRCPRPRPGTPYSIARLGRLGYPVNRQRWLYNFRNRHGFTDVADRVFDELWAGGAASWAELSEQSERALAARMPA